MFIFFSLTNYEMGHQLGQQKENKKKKIEKSCKILKENIKQEIEMQERNY